MGVFLVPHLGNKRPLDPIFRQHGTRWLRDGFKVAPRWRQMAPKCLEMAPDSSKIAFSPRRRANCAEIPSSAKKANDYPEMARDSPLHAPYMVAKWPRDGPEMAPTWTQDGPMMQDRPQIGPASAMADASKPSMAPRCLQNGPMKAPRTPKNSALASARC